MKIILLIASLLSVAVAQQNTVACRYYFLGESYACFVAINNPDGFNNFTEIGGIHLDGFTNEDVTLIYAEDDSDSTNLPSIICDTFPNMATVYLFNVGITEIIDSTFAGCSRITELMLIYNRISSVSTNAFASLVDMEYIDLEFNELTTLPENVFANQNNLKELHLNYNPIENLPTGLFRPLVNLEILEIISTNLNGIDTQWFATNERLLELSLSYSKIILPVDTIAGLGAVHTLDLGLNMIDGIPPGTFANLHNLQNLRLSGNNIPDLQPDSFTELGHLVTLDLNQNPIEVIHGGAFRGLENLTILEVGFGPLWSNLTPLHVLIFTVSENFTLHCEIQKRNNFDFIKNILLLLLQHGLDCNITYQHVLQSVMDMVQNLRNSNDMLSVYELAKTLILYGADPNDVLNGKVTAGSAIVRSTIDHYSLRGQHVNYGNETSSGFRGSFRTNSRYTLFYYIILITKKEFLLTDPNRTFARIIHLFHYSMAHEPLYNCLKSLHNFYVAQVPNKSTENLITLITSLYKRPRTLKQICRQSVYKSLNHKLALNINKLNLPGPLKEYMLSFEA